MFVYCGNSPVNRLDTAGCFWEEIWEWIVDRYEDAYSVYEQQQQLETQIIMEQNRIVSDAVEAVGDAAETVWDAYMWSHNQQQEVQLQQAIATRDFVADRFSTPEKASNTLNGIGFAVDAVGIYAGVALGPIPCAIITGVGLTFNVIAWGIDVANEG